MSSLYWQNKCSSWEDTMRFQWIMAWIRKDQQEPEGRGLYPTSNVTVQFQKTNAELSLPNMVSICVLKQLVPKEHTYTLLLLAIRSLGFYSEKMFVSVLFFFFFKFTEISCHCFWHSGFFSPVQCIYLPNSSLTSLLLLSKLPCKGSFKNSLTLTSNFKWEIQCTRGIWKLQTARRISICAILEEPTFMAEIECYSFL